MDWKNPTDSDLMKYIKNKYLEEMKELHSSKKEAIEDKYAEPLEVSPDEFFEFMDAKGISDKCSLCGSSDVMIQVGTYTEAVEKNSLDDDEPDQKRVKFASFTFLTSSSGKLTPSRPYYIRYCGNCGRLDLFRARQVIEWVKKYRKQQAEDASNE